MAQRYAYRYATVKGNILRFSEHAALVIDALGRLGYSQRKLGEAIGRSEGAVNLWVRGHKRPPPQALRAIGQLVPELNIRAQALAEGFQWHATKASHTRRFSPETIASLHQALDMILDHARSDIVEHVTKTIEKFAVLFGEERLEAKVQPRRLFLLTAKQAEQVHLVALDRGRDEDGIIRSIVELGITEYVRIARSDKTATSPPGRKKQRGAQHARPAHTRH